MCIDSKYSFLAATLFPRSGASYLTIKLFLKRPYHLRAWHMLGLLYSYLPWESVSREEGNLSFAMETAPEKEPLCL